jgi:hypothetical protein
MYIVEYIEYKIKSIRDFKEFKRNGYEQINILKKYAIQIKNYDLNNISIECYDSAINVLSQLLRQQFWEKQDKHKIFNLVFETVYLKNNDIKKIHISDYYCRLVEVIKILEKYME